MTIKLIIEAGKNIFQHKAVLAKALSIPSLIYFAILLAWGLTPEDTKNIPLGIFLGLVYLAIQTIIAVTTHRLVLLGSGAITQWGWFRWKKRETNFTLYVMGVFGILLGIGILWLIVLNLIKPFPISLFYATTFILWLPVSYITGRVSLVFPSVAIDHGIGFKESWELSEGYGVLMMWIVIISELFLIVPELLNQVLSLLASNEIFLTLIYVLTNMLYILITVFTIAALSLAYIHIRNEKERAEEPVAEPSFPV